MAGPADSGTEERPGLLPIAYEHDEFSSPMIIWELFRTMNPNGKLHRAEIDCVSGEMHQCLEHGSAEAGKSSLAVNSTTGGKCVIKILNDAEIGQ